jgi:hypothetical protein
MIFWMSASSRTDLFFISAGLGSVGDAGVGSRRPLL